MVLRGVRRTVETAALFARLELEASRGIVSGLLAWPIYVIRMAAIGPLGRPFRLSAFAFEDMFCNMYDGICNTVFSSSAWLHGLFTNVALFRFEALICSDNLHLCSGNNVIPFDILQNRHAILAELLTIAWQLPLCCPPSHHL